LEKIKGMGPIATHGTRGGRDSGAAHQTEQRALVDRCVDGRLAVGFLRDVAMHEHLTELLCKSFAGFILHVGNDDFAAVLDQHSYGTGAQPGGPAGHDENLVLDVHLFPLVVTVLMCGLRLSRNGLDDAVAYFIDRTESGNTAVSGCSRISGLGP